MPNGIQHSFARETKKPRQHRHYTGAFKTSLLQALLAETNGPPLELRRNELGQRYYIK